MFLSLTQLIPDNKQQEVLINSDQIDFIHPSPAIIPATKTVSTELPMACVIILSSGRTIYVSDTMKTITAKLVNGQEVVE